MTTLETAKQIIDAHASAVERLINNIESASAGLVSAFSSVRPLVHSQIESMASVEEAVHRSLSKDDIAAAKDYAETKLAALRERAFRELPKVGVNDTFTQTDIASIMARVKVQPLDGRKLSYAVGFVVCHRKCCQNDAGNGVAAGVGCWDCNDNVESESCPPV